MRLFEKVICFSKKSAAALILLAISIILSGCGKPQEGPNADFQEGPSLIFSTYLGGSIPFDAGSSAFTFAQNAACDTHGNTYVTGATQVSDLPVLNALQPAPSAGSTMSAFVAKYDTAGKLLWCTYLGGNKQSVGVGVTAMPDGGVAVAGLTTSDAPSPFPVKNAFQENNNGQSDYFVTVFNADGNLLYSTYLGGSGVEGEAGAVFADDSNNGNHIAADARGLLYITGETNSGSSEAIKFPITSNAIQSELGGSTDAFLCIIDPAKTGASSRIYSSFLGGRNEEKGHGITVNADGSQITMVGYTNSSNFPTTANAYRSYPAPSGYTSNGFITQFTSSVPGKSSSLYAARYSTYLGADSKESRDDTYAVALSPNGLIVATGRTQSADFPMIKSPVLTIYNRAPYLKPGTSNDEPYVVKISPSLSGEASLVYSTFMGGGSPTAGGGGAFCTSVAVGSDDITYAGGEVSSYGIEYLPYGKAVEAPSLFPYTKDALFAALQGEFDAMLMQISPNGAALAYSSFLGGGKSDRTYGLAVDSSGNRVITGLTFSSDFPLKNPAQTWPGNTGNQNAFITKIKK